MLAGFGKLGALSARGLSCPFDARRDGFVVGEGAAVVVLAVERGPARLELAGEARSLDAYHLTAPDPDGAGAERAMRGALAGAGEARVDYVQAHGTSTPLNDAVEAAAIRRVLGARSTGARVVGQGRPRALRSRGRARSDSCAACAAILDGCVLPTAGLREPDPACAAAPRHGARARPSGANGAGQRVRVRRRQHQPRPAGCRLSVPLPAAGVRRGRGRADAVRGRLARARRRARAAVRPPRPRPRCPALAPDDDAVPSRGIAS